MKNRAFLTQIKNLVYSLLALVIVVSALAVASGARTTYKYHYIGKTYITSDEYAQCALVVNTGTSKLVKTSSGLLFTYDFYGNVSYDFLDSTAITNKYIDNPSTAALKSVNWLMLLIITVIGIVLLYVVSVNRRRLTGFGVWVKRSTLKLKYSDVKELFGVSRVLSNPSDLQPEYTGLLGIRSWNFSNGVLTSLVWNDRWDKNSIVADTLPDKVNSTGIHSYRLGAPTVQSGEVMGLVEMRGKYEYHPDGVIRAENCHILVLFASNVSDKFARYLSIKYGVPVYVAADAKQACMSWLFSSEGIKGMQHNQVLLGV